ncbi:Zn-dependent hydrolase, partial [Nonomuraea sp. K274]|nr:Zn-dependent hydrolase [Nonomuraea cypriaca]
MAGMRTARRILAGGVALAAAGWALRDVPAELGVRPLNSGPDRAARIRRSRQFANGAFVNPMAEPTAMLTTPPVGLLGELAKDREQR